LIDNGVVPTTVGCGQLLPLCFASTPPTLQLQFDPVANAGAPELKNRTLPIKVDDVGQIQAVRVTWDTMPNWSEDYVALVGQAKWMTQPIQVCENSGNGLAVSPPNCGPSAGQPQKWFWAANLTCNSSAAYYANLTTLTNYCTVSGESCTTDGDCAAGTCGVDGVIHIFDQGIVPTKNMNQRAIYDVQVIDETCSVANDADYSDPLVLIQPVWGDIGNGTDCPMEPPNGVVSLVPDVTAALAKFSNNFCAPKKTRVEVEPAGLDMLVNITDVLKLLNAFTAVPYDLEAGPACTVSR